MPPLLHVDNLCVRHGGTTLVQIRDLTVDTGERLAVLGRSGSGKSLAAAAVTDTLPPSMQVSGTVTVHGTAVRHRGLGTPGTALVRQDSADALNPLVRVHRQLAIPRRGGRGDSRGGGHAGDMRQLLADVGLEDPDRVLSSYPAELSGGQRQRLCIALGIACGQDLLVTDECTTALDTVSQAAVVATLKRRTDISDSALVFITHDLAVAADLCDRAVVMDAGRVVDEGPVTRLMDAPSHPLTSDLVDEARTRYGWAA